VLLETPGDAAPTGRDPFLVIDSALRVQAVSQQAEIFLGVPEEEAVNRPVVELLVPADAEARGPTSFALAIAEAVGGSDDPVHVFLRPWNTFGVRVRARIAPCGPPRAALLVLESRPRDLRAVER
jgi:PAS domain-containing protein